MFDLFGENRWSRLLMRHHVTRSELRVSDVRALAIDQSFNDIEEQTHIRKTITLELTPK